MIHCPVRSAQRHLRRGSVPRPWWHQPLLPPLPPILQSSCCIRTCDEWSTWLRAYSSSFWRLPGRSRFTRVAGRNMRTSCNIIFFCVSGDGKMAKKKKKNRIPLLLLFHAWSHSNTRTVSLPSPPPPPPFSPHCVSLVSDLRLRRWGKNFESGLSSVCHGRAAEQLRGIRRDAITALAAGGGGGVMYSGECRAAPSLRLLPFQGGTVFPSRCRCRKRAAR